MQTLSEDEIQRLRDIANKNRVVTESDEEALLNQSSDATSSSSAELNFTGLSEIDARNDETEEAKANNSGKTRLHSSRMRTARALTVSRGGCT